MFDLQIILRHCTEWPENDIEHQTVKGTPYTCYNYPQNSKFTPFSSTTSCFWVAGHFKTSALNEPKMTLNTKRSKVPHIHVTTTPESRISIRFALRTFSSHMPLLRQVDRVTPKWSSTLKGCAPLGPHIYVTSTYESTISLRFILRTAVFDSYAPLRQGHQMTPNWSWTLKGQKYPHIHVTSTPEAHISFRFALRPVVFVIGHFEISAPNDPKMTLNTKRSKISHIHVTGTPPRPVPIFTPFRSTGLRFSVTGHFDTIAPKWLQKDREHKKVKGTPTYMLQVSTTPTPVSNFTPFCSTASRFGGTGRFQTNAPNNPELTLNTKRSTVPHISKVSHIQCMLQLPPESQFSLRFPLRLAIPVILAFFPFSIGHNAKLQWFFFTKG